MLIFYGSFILKTYLPGKTSAVATAINKLNIRYHVQYFGNNILPKNCSH